MAVCIKECLVHGVEAVDAPHLGSDGIGHFVVVIAFKADGLFVQADVAVAFHKAGSHDAAGGVDDLCIDGGAHFFAHSGDLAAIQQNLAVFDILAGHCFNQTIFNKNHGKHPPFQSYYLIAYLFPGKLSKKSPFFWYQIPRLLFMQFAKKLLYLYSLPLR